MIPKNLFFGCSKKYSTLSAASIAYYGKSDGNTTVTNASDFSMYLLNEANVSSVMGDAFGEPNCVRFSFANSMPNIEKAWARIKEALAKLK